MPTPRKSAKKPVALSIPLSSLHNFSGQVWSAKGLHQAEALVLRAMESGAVVKGEVETIKKGMVAVQAAPTGMVTS